MNLRQINKSFLWAVVLAPWSVVVVVLAVDLIGRVVSGRELIGNDVFPLIVICGLALLYAYVGMIFYGVPAALLLIYFKCRHLYHVILASVLPSILFGIFTDDGIAVAPYFAMFSALVAGAAWFIAEWWPNYKARQAQV